MALSLHAEGIDMDRFCTDGRLSDLISSMECWMRPYLFVGRMSNIAVTGGDNRARWEVTEMQASEHGRRIQMSMQ